MATDSFRRCLWAALLMGAGALLADAARADVPKELFDALKVDQSASPKQLYDAITRRYLDPAQGAGKGKYAQLWEPIAMSKYFDPHTFYQPPTTVKEVAGRAECVECHQDETPGWARAWKGSGHANLDQVRKLKPSDPRYYKKQELETVEKNLRSMGKLGANQNLKEVSCIDCHVDIGTTKKADHRKDLRLPTAEVCGTCHLEQFAERESERDTQNWPQNQWPAGRPSHALDYRANVETGIWAGMPQREVAEGCTACHHNQNKCDTCHTRHEFSVVEARSGTYILEDDYDSDFRYRGSPLTALMGLDRHGSVIYLGTFSKSMGAGLRLGYLIVPPQLIEPARTVKALLDNGHPWLDQAAMAEFLASGSYAKHLRRIRQLYRERRDCLVETLLEHFGEVELSRWRDANPEDTLRFHALRLPSTGVHWLGSLPVES
jgi:hypothetical protein